MNETNLSYTDFEVGVPVETFFEQVRYLKKYYNLVPLNEILSVNKTNVVSITLDDGYYDNYKNAFPVLKDQGISATFFVATNFINSSNFYWFDEVKMICQTLNSINKILSDGKDIPLELIEKLIDLQNNFNLAWDECLQNIKIYLLGLESKERSQVIKKMKKLGNVNFQTAPEIFSLMTWDQINEMNEKGMHFGGHTHTHPFLDGLEPCDIRKELEVSNRILSDKLKESPKAFCYPAGRYDAMAESMVKSAGYELGVTTDQDFIRNDYNKYLLPRIAATRENLPFFVAGVSGFFSLTTAVKTFFLGFLKTYKK